MTMFKILITYYLALLGSMTFAQSADTFKISGIVVSLNTSKSIPYGTIMVTPTKGYQSDSLGHFTIYNLSKGKHDLTFSAEGFDTIDTTVLITDKNIIDFKLRVFTDCYSFPHFSEKTAERDISAGLPRLLLLGGISPIYYSDQKKFEKKFRVVYYDFGCTPDRNECILAYNRTVFAYLDKVYGDKWRKEVRKDVIGLYGK